MNRHRLVICIGLVAAAAWLSPVLQHTASAQLPKDPFRFKGKGSRSFNDIQYFAQNGRDVNFGFAAIKWKGPGGCNQKEDMKPVISVQGESVTIRNAVLIEPPDGIHVSGKNARLENIIIPEVCEDGVTANPGADGLVIRNCAFRGADDKAIQLNGAKNILIENCIFERCAKPVLAKNGVTVTIRNCRAKDFAIFVVAEGSEARVVVENVTAEKGRKFADARDGAQIVMRDCRLAGVREKNSGDVKTWKR